MLFSTLILPDSLLCGTLIFHIFLHVIHVMGFTYELGKVRDGGMVASFRAPNMILQSPVIR